MIRGTTADEDGYISMEHEATTREDLSIAQAVHNAGGTVICQVKRLAKRGSLNPQMVKIPGFLVDYLVVEPEQMQTFATFYDPSRSGETRVPVSSIVPDPMSERRVMARRAAFELRPGDVVNLGVGVSAMIPNVAAEEGIEDMITLTVEAGVVGGVPGHGREFGTAINPRAILDQGYQFDFYDGGGLSCAFLSFAEVDAAGNVNVTRFGNRFAGAGGFIDITQNTRAAGLQRHADRRRIGRFGLRRWHCAAAGGPAAEIRGRGGADQLQRRTGAGDGPAGEFRDRAGRVRVGARRPRADRNRARRALAGGRARPDGLHTPGQPGAARHGRPAVPRRADGPARGLCGAAAAAEDTAMSLFLEDIIIGQSYVTAEHEVTAADIAAFGELTRDRHPLHTDAAYSRARGFPGVIAHGLYGVALMEGLKTELGLYADSSLASLGWDKVRFRAAVVAGDRLHLRFAFTAKRPSRTGGRGVVTERLELVNQDGLVVIDAEHTALILARQPEPGGAGTELAMTPAPPRPDMEK